MLAAAKSVPTEMFCEIYLMKALKVGEKYEGEVLVRSRATLFLRIVCEAIDNFQMTLNVSVRDQEDNFYGNSYLQA